MVTGSLALRLGLCRRTVFCAVVVAALLGFARLGQERSFVYDCPGADAAMLAEADNKTVSEWRSQNRPPACADLSVCLAVPLFCLGAAQAKAVRLNSIDKWFVEGCVALRTTTWFSSNRQALAVFYGRDSAHAPGSFRLGAGWPPLCGLSTDNVAADTNLAKDDIVNENTLQQALSALERGEEEEAVKLAHRGAAGTP